MTRDIKDIITDFREVVKPRIAKMLLEANFEGCGKEDKAEFETEFEMILTLAERGATVEPQEKYDELMKQYKHLRKYASDLETRLSVEPQTCITCKHSDEVDGEHCYECVKGDKDNFEVELPKDEVLYGYISKQFPTTNVFFDSYETALNSAIHDQPHHRPFYIIKATRHFEFCGIVNGAKGDKE